MTPDEIRKTLEVIENVFKEDFNMTTLPHDIQNLIEAEAEAEKDCSHDINRDITSYRLGAKRLYSLLLERESGFDEKALVAYWIFRAAHHEFRKGFEEGARWQFERDAVQIEALKEELKRAQNLIRSCYGFVEADDRVGITHAEVKSYISEIDRRMK